MAIDETGPYAVILDAHRKMVADAKAHAERYRRCEEEVFNKWPSSVFPSLEREFTDASISIGHNLSLYIEDEELVLSDETRKSYLLYAVRENANHRVKVLPKLKLELRDDCTVRSNIKNEAGEPFIIQVDGDLVTEQLRSLLAALLGDSLKAFLKR